MLVKLSIWFVENEMTEFEHLICWNWIDEKIVGRDDQIVSDESDLASISDRLRLVSIDGVEEEIAAEEKEKLEKLAMSDEEFARLIQVLHKFWFNLWNICVIWCQMVFLNC